MNVPKGLKLNLNRIDDKNLEISLIGKTNVKNNTLLKLILLEDFFENTQSDFKGISKNIMLNFAEDKDNKNEFNVIDRQQSCIMNIEFVNYAVVLLKHGNMNDYEIFIDGEKVNPSAINELGSIVKVEVKDRKSKDLVVKQGDKKDEFTLNFIEY